YSRVIMLKLGRIAFFYSLVFFMANIDRCSNFLFLYFPKTPFSSIFGDRDMIYDLFLLQVCE
ncbi:hypothetical protein BSU19_24030, partial [Salmonella enterica subsp. enterica serovar Enteritidis]